MPVWDLAASLVIWLLLCISWILDSQKPSGAEATALLLWEVFSFSILRPSTLDHLSHISAREINHASPFFNMKTRA